MLAEASYRYKKLALYGKYEFVQKSTEELNLDENIYGNNLFNVNAYTLGANYDLLQLHKTKIALGMHFTFNNEHQNCIACMGKILQRLKSI